MHLQYMQPQQEQKTLGLNQIKIFLFVNILSINHFKCTEFFFVS